MTWTITPPCKILQGDCIAQLLLLPYFVPQASNVVRGNQGFGSTRMPQILWAQKITQSQPMLTLTIKDRSFTGLLDTGADISIISQKELPRDWPIGPAFATVSGVGGIQIPLQSLIALTVVSPEGRKASLCPYVMSVPCNL